VQVEAIKTELENAKMLIMAKYPLIKCLNGAEEKDIVDYIKMVDKQ